MKFIPKKSPGGLVSRYLQANQYTINPTTAPKPAEVPVMVEPPIPYFTPEQTRAQLARQALAQAAYNRSVVPTDISGPTIIGKDTSIVTPTPTMNTKQGQLTPRTTTIPVTPGSVSGINELIEQWKSGYTSQTAPVVTEPKWRMPIQGEMPAGTVDKMRQEREAGEAKSKPTKTKPAIKASKPITKTYPGPDEMANRPLAKGMHRDYETGRTAPHYSAPIAKTEKTLTNPTGKVGQEKAQPKPTPKVEPKKKSKLVDHTPPATQPKKVIAKPNGMSLTNKEVLDYANMPEHTWASLAKKLSTTDMARIKKAKAFANGK